MAAEDFEQALDSADEVELTVTGRTSGRTSMRPVWFVVDRRKVLLVPVSGTDSQWFKNVVADPRIRLSVKGNGIDATATPHTDAATVDSAVDKLRRKYGAGDIKRYYAKLDAAVEVSLG